MLYTAMPDWLLEDRECWGGGASRVANFYICQPSVLKTASDDSNDG